MTKCPSQHYTSVLDVRLFPLAQRVFSLQQLPAERVDETISDRDLQEQIELVMAEARHGMWEAAEQRSKGGG